MRMICRYGRLLAMLAALALPAACGGEVGLVMVGASAVSFATTDKFLTDHAASYATGEECSALQFEQTGEYCRTADEIAAVEAEEEARRLAAAPEMYCYRTLGEITCYAQEDHQASLVQRVR